MEAKARVSCIDVALAQCTFTEFNTRSQELWGRWSPGIHVQFSNLFMSSGHARVRYHYEPAALSTRHSRSLKQRPFSPTVPGVPGASCNIFFQHSIWIFEQVSLLPWHTRYIPCKPLSRLRLRRAMGFDYPVRYGTTWNGHRGPGAIWSS